MLTGLKILEGVKQTKTITPSFHVTWSSRRFTSALMLLECTSITERNWFPVQQMAALLPANCEGNNHRKREIGWVGGRGGGVRSTPFEVRKVATTSCKQC